MPKLPPPRVPLDKDAKHLTQSWLWPQIEAFLQPGDIVVSETGTSNFGIVDTKFPENVSLVTQIYYGALFFIFKHSFPKLCFFMTLTPLYMSRPGTDCWPYRKHRVRVRCYARR